LKKLFGRDPFVRLTVDEIDRLIERKDAKGLARAIKWGDYRTSLMASARSDIQCEACQVGIMTRDSCDPFPDHLYAFSRLENPHGDLAERGKYWAKPAIHVECLRCGSTRNLAWTYLEDLLQHGRMGLIHADDWASNEQVLAIRRLVAAREQVSSDASSREALYELIDATWNHDERYAAIVALEKMTEEDPSESVRRLKFLHNDQLGDVFPGDSEYKLRFENITGDS